MTKCSNWLAGHDKAAALNHPVPDPDELLSNIEEAEVWVKKIRDRRR